MYILYYIIFYYIILYCIILYYIILYYIILYYIIFVSLFMAFIPMKASFPRIEVTSSFQDLPLSEEAQVAAGRFPGRHGGSPIAGWFISTGTSQRKMENWGYAHDLGIIHL